MSLDLRYVLVPAINLVKGLNPDSTWDPFGVISNPTWLKFWFLTILTLFVSFFSIQITRTRTSPSLVFAVRPQSFSVGLLVSFMASVILPQLLFWYLYPVILLLSTNFVSALFLSCGTSLQAFLSRTPHFFIHVAQHEHPQGEEIHGPQHV